MNNVRLVKINQLSDERRNLWRKGGHGGLSISESKRVQEITDELENLWDTYRREIARGHRPQTHDEAERFIA